LFFGIEFQLTGISFGFHREIENFFSANFFSKLKNDFLDLIKLFLPKKEKGFYLTMGKQTTGFNGFVNFRVH